MTILAALWVKSCLILLCAWLLTRRREAGHAALRHWVWTLAFAALALMPVIPIGVSEIPLRWLPPSSAAPEPVPTSDTAYPAARQPLAPVREAFAGSTSTGPRGTDLPGTWPWWIWLAGAAFAGARLGAELRTLSVARRDAVAVPAAWANPIRRCARRLGLSSVPEVALSDEVHVPLVVGLLRPTLLLPIEARRWSADRVGMVLLHEMAHVARGDHFTTLLGEAMCVVYWPNPWIRRAAQRYLVEREHACDERVLHTGMDRVRYARHLLDAARGLRPASRSAVPALGSAAGFRQRIETILRGGPDRSRLSPGLAIGSAGLLLLLVVPLAVARLDRPAADPRVQAALDDLRQGDASARTRAAWSLGEREDAAAVDALIETLDSQDPELRGMAAWALGEIKDTRALPALIERLPDTDPYAHEMLLRSVGEIHSPDSLRAVLPYVEDPGADVRATAIEALVDYVHDRRVREVVLRALDDPAPQVRRAAAMALGEGGVTVAVDPLIHATRDPDAAVRAAAVWALDEINVPPP